MSEPSLTAAEALVLLDPENSSGREAFKVTLLSLIAQGTLRIEERVETHMEGAPTFNHVLIASVPPNPPAHVSAMLRTVKSALDHYGIVTVVGLARQEYGRNLNGFKDGYVVPALMARRLLKKDKKWLLGLIPLPSISLTASGETERRRLSQTMEQARTLPEMLKSHPERAVALVAALGGAIFLVSQLQSYYGEIAAAMRTPMPDNSAVLNSATAMFMTSGLGGLGASSLGAFDQTLQAIDSGFDSSMAGGGVGMD